jgi:hypothetical protein
MRKLTSLIVSTAFVVLVMAGSAWSQEDTKSLLKQLREDTDRFAKSLNHHLDDSRIDGSQTEDEINRYVKEFDNAIENLKSDWENGRDAKGSAEGVGASGKVINGFLKKHHDKFTPTIHTEWNSVKMDIGRIAKANKIKVEW